MCALSRISQLKIAAADTEGSLTQKDIAAIYIIGTMCAVCCRLAEMKNKVCLTRHSPN